MQKRMGDGQVHLFSTKCSHFGAWFILVIAAWCIVQSIVRASIWYTYFKYWSVQLHNSVLVNRSFSVKFEQHFEIIQFIQLSHSLFIYYEYEKHQSITHYTIISQRAKQWNPREEERKKTVPRRGRFSHSSANFWLNNTLHFFHHFNHTQHYSRAISDHIVNNCLDWLWFIVSLAETQRRKKN